MTNDRGFSRKSGTSFERGPTPYKLISFPNKPLPRSNPPGHHKYLPNHLHGTLFLILKVETALHISVGAVVRGSDIGENISLIKAMVQGSNQRLLIQGSSLKGCIRSVYEAITNSRLGVVTKKYRDEDKYPQERLPCDSKDKLCPASLVFGTSGENWGWRGLIDFRDAECERGDFSTGFMPSLWSPQPYKRRAYFNKGKAAGRKFYYHMVRSLDKGEKGGIPVQQAGRTYTFTTSLHFMNLKPEELGTLLVVLGQDRSKYPLALKIGGGKPIGMGSMTVTVAKANMIQNLEELQSRYSSYISEPKSLTGESLQEFMQTQIQEAYSHLIQEPQLKDLYEVLGYGKTPITREAWEKY